MDGVEIRRALQAEQVEIDRALGRLLAAEKGVPPRLRRAMRHSLTGGGKRLRPVLMLWARDAWTKGARAGDGEQVSRERVLTAACGLEMIHTYSLIHDDLPAMDDDVLRRGRPTCHVVFGQATAILAGDALQALGFTLLARAGGALAGPLVALVGDAAGPAGMVGGQQDDLEAEGGPVTGALVRRIHARKTACLLAAALAGGALLGGAGAAGAEAARRAGLDLGLAFQGADDVLDETASAVQLGKSPGKDAAAGKATWIRVEGRERAARRAARDGQRGLRRLAEAVPEGPAADRLLGLGRLMWNRDR
jgi:geranylgeranyl pyrophosphate synthase